jgi:hypothetical protein
MNKKSLLLILTVAGMAVLFIAGSIIAGTTVDDVIKMQNKAYSEHKKGIVEFTHKKHAEDYEISCGDCHHDDQGKPLDLKEGDDVQGCIECHSKPGEKPKGKDAPKLTKQEALEYHAEAIHSNCRDCHRAYNKEHETKAAPTTCTGCHPKTK